ncbi:MAG: Gx transporter family protein [Bacilli bacterium]|jgi:heptaprenyl diphosphate synthase|nr:Gx transporter family protein [Bacilli bacterium]
MKAKNIAAFGVYVALAMIFSYIELQIPPLVAIPGIKLGLPNVVIIIAMYKFGWKEAILINILRVLLVSVLFGTVLSLLYSIAGAILSLFVMIILKKSKIFSTVLVSVFGAISHNIGQITVAIFVLETSELLYYLPVLIITGTISGVLLGLIGATIVKKLDNIKI